MIKDEYLAKLRELGFSDYSLRLFRKSQREFKQRENDILKLNKNAFKNESTITAFTYETLYNYAVNMGESSTIAVRNIIESQQNTLKSLDEDGLTPQIIDFIREVNSVLLRYGFNAYNSLMQNFKKAKQEQVIGDYIDEINFYLNEIYRYEETFGQETCIYQYTVGGQFSGLNTAIEELYMVCLNGI